MSSFERRQRLYTHTPFYIMVYLPDVETIDIRRGREDKKVKNSQNGFHKQRYNGIGESYVA